MLLKLWYVWLQNYRLDKQHSAKKHVIFGHFFLPTDIMILHQCHSCLRVNKPFILWSPPYTAYQPLTFFFFQNPSLQCCYCCLVSLAECVKLWLYQKLQHSVWLQRYDSGQTKKLFWANLGILWFYIGVTKIITCFKTNRQVTLGQFLPFYSPGGSKR